eukprot:CAMPEP_0171857394 /NCGR_PEP_ID=MMETSP0992-20121227/24668_1 /TAXON_ID=483369 /ORGANISM="non described non described, Strain CCMP2098" /LENGTH=92 /DNA_ID=CAMNT_0012478631 /DNA_START=478 /DNA_END=756 /DNA_ORIENTATION=-
MVRTSTAAASSTNENKKIARATFWVTVRACESNSASSWSAFWNSSSWMTVSHETRLAWPCVSPASPLPSCATGAPNEKADAISPIGEVAIAP